MKKKRRQNPPMTPKRRFGVVWYRRSQWQRLRELAADKDNIHDTFDEWHMEAKHRLRILKRNGLHVVPVEVDVDEMAQWCADNDLPFDGAGRAKFVADKLEKADDADE